MSANSEYVKIETKVEFDGDNIKTTWAIGDVSLSTAFPKDDARFEQSVQDLAWLCDNLPFLVDLTTTEVEKAAQEREAAAS